MRALWREYQCPAALDIETSLVVITPTARGRRVGTPDFPETILFEDVDPVHHDSIVWGWSMRSNFWPAEDISEAALFDTPGCDWT